MATLKGTTITGQATIKTNNTWLTPSELILGRTNSNINSKAVIGVTDGNLHLDSYDGKGLYLNCYQTTKSNSKVYFNGDSYYIQNGYFNGAANSATNDSDGNEIKSTYLKKSGSSFIFNDSNIPEEAANFNTAANANKITFFKNGLLIPYTTTNPNDGGIIRCLGDESTCRFEIATWDDSGAGETIQFNYYPTTSQITPTYSVSVPKKSGTIALTNENISTFTNDSGYITNGQDYNFMNYGNEFTFAPSGYSGGIYFNYRTQGGTNGNITEYYLGNGKGGSLGTIIHTGNIGSQSVSYASSSGTLSGFTKTDSAGWGYMGGNGNFHFINGMDAYGGSDLAWFYNGGQVSEQLDGTVFVNEGTYEVVYCQSYSNGTLTLNTHYHSHG